MILMVTIAGSANLKRGEEFRYSYGRIKYEVNMSKIKQTPCNYKTINHHIYDNDRLKGKTKSFQGDIPVQKGCHKVITINIELQLWHIILGMLIAWGVYKFIAP